MPIASAVSLTELVRSRASAKRWGSVPVMRRRDPVGRGVSGSSVMSGHLVVISGLPGIGKTSVAGNFAGRSGFIHLSIDAIEESILACGLSSRWQVVVAAYEAARAIAEQNLHL